MLSMTIATVAPLKALCSEKFQDWKTRFGPLGVKCVELTGDTEPEDYLDLQDAHIIFTTPVSILRVFCSFNMHINSKRTVLNNH